MAKAAINAKNAALNEQSVARESEQVCETAEQYLDWYMNRTQFEISDKMVELEDSIEKDCSCLYLRVIEYESSFLSHYS